jgi:uncharacterized repeat protein (TIGR01451 family)
MVALPLLAEVTVQLTAYKVVKNAGKETLSAADKMMPGETVEYKAVYKNTNKSAVHDVKASLPIPQGMQFVPNTAVPAAPMASTDGVKFSKLPLMKQVKGADGKMHEEPVPYSESIAALGSRRDSSGRQQDCKRTHAAHVRTGREHAETVNAVIANFCFSADPQKHDKQRGRRLDF